MTKHLPGNLYFYLPVKNAAFDNRGDYLHWGLTCLLSDTVAIESQFGYGRPCLLNRSERNMSVHQENVTVGEAIERFGIARTKLYELIREGDIEAFKLGRRTLINISSIRALLAGLPRIGGRP